MCFFKAVPKIHRSLYFISGTIEKFSEFLNISKNFKTLNLNPLKNSKNLSIKYKYKHFSYKFILFSLFIIFY